MTDLQQATTEYLRREQAANKTVKGADHAAIAAQVADDFGVPLTALKRSIHKATVLGAI